MIAFLPFRQLLIAQQLEEIFIEQCYQLAANNSPLYQQNALTVAVGNKAEKNLSLKWLPKLDLKAQATYQSDVTALPIKIPNITIQQLDKEQCKGTLELVQPVLMAVLLRDKKNYNKLLYPKSEYTKRY